MFKLYAKLNDPALRAFLSSLLSSLGIFASAFGLGSWISNSRYLSQSDAFLKDWTSHLVPVSSSDWDQLVLETYRRVHVYEQEIEKNHLSQGMLVNRRADGRVLDECDSLLFSSLRYVSLKKLGFEEKSLTAWQAIEKSQKNGLWFRHPDCTWQDASRDMMAGLIAALAQRPPGYQKHLLSLFDYLKKNMGFFGEGPPYLSFMTPQLALELKQMALDNGMEYPLFLETGFSTLEWESLFLKRGYQSHLTSLHAWLSMEYANKYPQKVDKSIAFHALSVLDFLNKDKAFDQRMKWISYNLVSLDGKNLFFRWLRFKASGLDTRELRARLLQELLSMREFPSGSLPQDCDRYADYLWQRDSIEYKAQEKPCGDTFSGVDFLWMAALLLSE